MKIIKLIAGLLLLVPGFHSNAQQTPLFSAVKNNNAQQVKALLEKGADPNAVDAASDSDNVLIDAAMYASADCMKLLLDKKANPNSKNKFAQTALMFCSRDTGKIKLLLQYGADINAKSNAQSTVLSIACIGSNQYPVVKFLIDRGADPSIVNAAKETSLICTAYFGDTMTMALLLSKGVDINAKTWDGWTALLYSVRHDNFPAVLYLLNHGADANIAGSYNFLPIMNAGTLNNLTITKALIKNTKDINASDSITGLTPLMWAVYNEHDNPQIVQAFLDGGALLNIKDKRSLTALSWAMMKGNTATVALLKKNGAE